MKPLLVFFLLANIFICSCCQPDKIALKGTLPVDTAKKLVSNFDERAFKRPDRKGFNDTRCVWFPIGQLEKLVKKIRCEKGDGVRFYLAAYDLDSSSYCEDIYRDHTTLIMVSTKRVVRDEKKDTIHLDYYGKKENGINVGAILTADPENHGELCPPPGNCESIGATLFQP